MSYGWRRVRILNDRRNIERVKRKGRTPTGDGIMVSTVSITTRQAGKVVKR